MDIQFRCPCGAIMREPEEKAGSRIACSQCGRLLIVPGVPVAAGVREHDPQGSLLEAEEADEAEAQEELEEAVEPKTAISGTAVASLVLGLVGPFLGVLALLAGVLALVFGGVALRSISRGRRVKGRGTAIAGMVLGGIDVLLGLTFLLAMYGARQADDSLTVVHVLLKWLP